MHILVQASRIRNRRSSILCKQMRSSRLFPFLAVYCLNSEDWKFQSYIEIF